MLYTPIEVRKTQGSLLAPAKMWDSLRTEVESLFDRFGASFEPEFRPFEYFWPKSESGFASVAVDVIRGEKAYTITAEIPGMKEKDLEVSVSDDAIVVKGEKMQEFHKEDGLYVSERSYGAFQRTFALPKDVDRKNIVAKYANGVLTVTVPRIANVEKLHRIEVKAA